MSDGFDWSETNIERLRTLWAEGHSTAEIGRRLGVSKNAVVGKAGRLDLPARESPIRPAGSGRPRQLSRHVCMEAAQLPTLTSVPIPPAVMRDESNPHRDASLNNGGIRACVIKVEEAPSVTFKPIASRPCCWPMWGAGRPTHEYCGAETRAGKPYCPEHHARAFTRLQSEAGDMAPWVRRDQGLRVAGDVGA